MSTRVGSMNMKCLPSNNNSNNNNNDKKKKRKKQQQKKKTKNRGNFYDKSQEHALNTAHNNKLCGIKKWAD
ncbi:hypothetical protein ACLKA6_016592 [Drosophila palustris]